MGRIWDDVLTERDKQVFAAAGYGQRGGFGTRPALLIDVSYNFVGDRPEPILESIKRFHTSCGEEGWQAVDMHTRYADVIAVDEAIEYLGSLPATTA